GPCQLYRLFPTRGLHPHGGAGQQWEMDPGAAGKIFRPVSLGGLSGQGQIVALHFGGKNRGHLWGGGLDLGEEQQNRRLVDRALIPREFRWQDNRRTDFYHIFWSLVPLPLRDQNPRNHETKKISPCRSWTLWKRVFLHSPQCGTAGMLAGLGNQDSGKGIKNR